MNRPMTDESTGHPDELLPWYANGTLDEPERARVAAHLAECARCREELSFLTTLAAGVRAADESGASADFGGESGGELGLRRLLREVRQTSPNPAPARGGRRTWWRPALAAAAILVIAVQGVMLGRLYQDTTYLQPLAGPAAAGTVLQVRFDPAASESQIRAALQSVDGTLIGGPGALGIYRVRLEGAGTDASAIARRIAELRARHGVVDYVAED